MRIYISGPITGTNDYFDRFNNATKKLLGMGHDVFNPVDISVVLPRLEDYEYLKIDFELLKMCDAIYLLEGWEASEGAKAELLTAIHEDKKVIVQGREGKIFLKE